MCLRKACATSSNATACSTIRSCFSKASSPKPYSTHQFTNLWFAGWMGTCTVRPCRRSRHCITSCRQAGSALSMMTLWLPALRQLRISAANMALPNRWKPSIISRKAGGSARKRSLAEQKGREFTPVVSTKRACDAALPAHAKFAEIRLRSFLSAQSFQSGTPPLLTRKLQAEPHRCSRRVAATLFRIGSRLLWQTETGSNPSDST